MRRLTKRDVEALLRDYDVDPVGALTVALRRVLGDLDDPGHREAQALDFDALIEVAPLTPAQRVLLHRREQRALDDLATMLNEERRLGI